MKSYTTLTTLVAAGALALAGCSQTDMQGPDYLRAGASVAEHNLGCKNNEMYFADTDSVPGFDRVVCGDTQFYNNPAEGQMAVPDSMRDDLVDLQRILTDWQKTVKRARN